MEQALGAVGLTRNFAEEPWNMMGAGPPAEQEMLNLSRARKRMVDVQIGGRGIRDRNVLEAMRRVPREAFVDPGLEEFAYKDGPLPIAEGQTISQPYIVALMIEIAEIGPGDHVLEVGTGSGYAAAVTSRIVERVYTIERHAGLAETARQQFEKLGYDNIEVRTGDGTKGWTDAAPFDAILVAAGGPGAPLALQEQLDVGGRLVIPVGDEKHSQRLLRVTRTGAATYAEEDFGAVRFVPLIGEQGWSETGERVGRDWLSGQRTVRSGAELGPDTKDIADRDHRNRHRADR
jgi:protein-L-isoaspartate(D-aspartate) O-methyltransferase